MAYLTHGFTIASSNPVSYDDPSVKLYGTFYPFPHDRAAGFEIEKPTVDSKKTSTLDYVFLSKDARYVEVVDCKLKLSSFDDGVVPLTDHLPMHVKFRLT